MKINNHIVLDFNKTKQVDTQTIQCDMNSRFVRVSLRHNNSPIDLSDVRVCIMAVKPDGKEIFNDCTVIDAQNGIAEFEITKQMGIVVGEVECQIKLFGKEKLLSSNIFNLSVSKSLSPDSQGSKDQLNTLVDSLNRVDQWDGKFEQKYNGLEQKYAHDVTEIKGLVVGNDLVERMSEAEQGLAQTNAQLSSKASTKVTDNLQVQINNLVLESGGDSNLEVVQARGEEAVLNDRLNTFDTRLDNLDFMKEFTSISFGKILNEYIDVEFTTENTNGIAFSNSISFDNTRDCYLIIRHTNADKIDFAVHMKDGVGVVSKDFNVGASTNEVTLLKFNTSNLTRNTFTLYIAKGRQTSYVTIHSIDIMYSDKITDEDLLKKIISNQIEMKKLYAHNILYDELDGVKADVKDVSEKLSNANILKEFNNISYGKVYQKYIGTTFTTENLNGDIFTDTMTLDTPQDCYLIIRHTNANKIDFAIHMRSGSQTISKDLIAGVSTNEVTLLKFPLSQFTGTSFTMAVAKGRQTSYVTFHSIDIIPVSEVDDEEILKSVILTESEMKKTYNYNVLENKINKIEDEINGKPSIPVVCIGDSIMHQMEGTIANLVKDVRDACLGGEKVITTVGRFGGYFNWYVEPFTIPSTTTPVDIVLKSTYNDEECNPAIVWQPNVEIKGVKGVLIDKGNYNFTFTRNVAGDSVVLKTNTIIKTYAQQCENLGDNFIPIIFMGTNGGYDMQHDGINNFNDLVTIHEKFIQSLGVKNYFILGFYKQGGHIPSGFVNYANNMKKAFGDRFWDLRDYLVNECMDDMGLQKTELDLELISQNKVPISLLDGDNPDTAVHMTNEVAIFVAKKVVEQALERGILTTDMLK